MTQDFISLFFIVAVAFVCPILARLVPGRAVPETVFLLIAGALLGPYAANVIVVTDAVDLLSELGLAFLFLLAGYEISPKNLTGKQGKRGLATWAISLVLAFLAVRFCTNFSVSHLDGMAVAIALTTTALGALMPILAERGVLGTPVGDAVLAYGTWGELGPVLAMALLLSTRAEWLTVLVLVLFTAVAVLVGVLPKRARKAGSAMYRFVSANSDTTSQTTVRITVLLLVGLVALSAVFDLDVVLGAFAAGFLLRYIVPEGNHVLETKLDGIAYGFLVPVFFVVSGSKIDLSAVLGHPVWLAVFIGALVLIRFAPIVISLSTSKEGKALSPHNRVSVGFYCTTALPVIVAVTSVAVNAGALSAQVASVLVAAGAVTVFLMPLLASLFYRVADTLDE